LLRHRGMVPLGELSKDLAGPARIAFSGWLTPFRLEDATGDALCGRLAELGVQAVVPLVSGETVLGFAALGERHEKALWRDDDLEHAAGLAGQAVVALEGTWQSQEASHWRRLSEAKDEWRQLDPTARLIYLAVARLGGPAPGPIGDFGTALRNVLVEAGASLPEARIAAAVERLVATGALSRDPDGALRPERETWLLLPEARQPLAEIARGTRLRVGAYELYERIGSGGMGDVYRAENVHDRSPAAVKLLPDRIGEDEDLRQRFEREGAIVAQLAHPNIVRLLGRGEHEGRLYLAMELLDGEPLSGRLRRGAMPSAEVLAGIRDIASALGALHERDVIHRDVKTSNVMRTASGRWVLLDFGLARSLLETTRTGEGSLVGTLPYMSPERIKGRPGGKSADIWALGIVLFQLLTGRYPWESLINETLIVEITQTRPDVARFVAPVAGAELSTVVEAMLDPDPETRMPDGAALLRALENVRVVEGAGGWPSIGADGPQLVDTFDSRADTA
jgi:protein kinase-like protein